MPKPQTFAALSQQVDDETIVLATLGELRTTLNYNRLGKYVLAEISDRLNSAGLGYFPTPVLDDNPTPRKEDTVRLYRKGVGVGKLIEAVCDPSDKGDLALQEYTDDSSDVLSQIRDLVCPME